MSDNISEYKNSKLFYKKTGAGQRALLAFHGFGEDHRAFELLSKALTADYTIYAFDIYFHGKSEWRYSEQPLEKAFWKEVIDNFIDENDIDQFSLIGFSIGCRFVLTSIETFPDKIESIFLLAPDGINVNFWYTISTRTALLRRFFKSLIYHPTRLKIIIDTIRKLHLMDKRLLKFVEHQMNTEEKRKKVYYSWVVLRHLKFDVNSLTHLINDKKIPITVFVGKNDSIVPPSSIKGFMKKLQIGRFEIVDNSHTGLLKDPSIIELIKK